jgi:hypothetical protein
MISEYPFPSILRCFLCGWLAGLRIMYVLLSVLYMQCWYPSWTMMIVMWRRVGRWGDESEALVRSGVFGKVLIETVAPPREFVSDPP